MSRLLPTNLPFAEGENTSSSIYNQLIRILELNLVPFDPTISATYTSQQLTELQFPAGSIIFNVSLNVHQGFDGVNWNNLYEPRSIISGQQADFLVGNLTINVVSNFVPSDLSGLYRWYDADDLTAQADGTAIASFDNKANAGNPATQTVAANKPVKETDAGGYTYLDFPYASGTERYMQCVEKVYNGTKQYTTFVVCEKRTTINFGAQMPAGGYLLSFGKLGTAFSGLFYPTGTSPFDPTALYSAGGNTNNNEFANLTGQVNQKKLLQVATIDYVNTAGGLNAYGDPLVNSQTTGSASSNASTTLDLSTSPNLEYYIGVGCNAGSTGTGPTTIELTTTFGGKLYEIVEYDRILSTAERQQVEVYLSGKWGVT
jgi:hypothetical protein